MSYNYRTSAEPRPKRQERHKLQGENPAQKDPAQPNNEHRTGPRAQDGEPGRGATGQPHMPDPSEFKVLFLIFPASFNMTQRSDNKPGSTKPMRSFAAFTDEKLRGFRKLDMSLPKRS